MTVFRRAAPAVAMWPLLASLPFTAAGLCPFAAFTCRLVLLVEDVRLWPGVVEADAES